MAGLMSIGGLSSGLDTATIVNQLMQLEAIPQDKLKARLSGHQATQKALQDLNTQVAYVQSLAAELADGTGWEAIKASSSSKDVTATATGSANPTSFSVTVNQVAQAHRLSFNTTASLDEVIVADGTEVELTINGSAHTIDTGDGTLKGLVDAINNSDVGVRATTIKLDDGSHRLSLTATETGAAQAFTLTNPDDTDLLGGAAIRAGQDAQISVGADVIHSATNTFTDLAPGVSITITADAVGTSADINVVKDASGVANKMADLVERVNATLSQIDRLTAYDPETRKAGALAGNSTVRDLRNALLSSVYPTDGTSMVSVGLQTDRSGKLVFDKAAFTDAYAADPAGTMAKFTAGDIAGFAARVDTVAKAASDKVNGSLTVAITGQESNIKTTQNNIDSWDRRLELRRATLERQFVALETALSQMHAQSDWLAGQLQSLPSNKMSNR